jgi:5-aminolevulinate synthase
MGALESIQILASDEGRALRDTHKANVSYLREKLFDAGVWAQHTPSHIIPVHVRLSFSVLSFLYYKCRDGLN